MTTTQGEIYRALLNYVNVEEYAFDEAVMKARVKADTKAEAYANYYTYANTFNAVKAGGLALTCVNAYIEVCTKVKNEIKADPKANDDAYTENEKIAKYKIHASAYASALTGINDDYDYAAVAAAEAVKTYARALTRINDDYDYAAVVAKVYAETH